MAFSQNFMDISDQLTAEHDALRRKIAALQAAFGPNAGVLLLDHLVHLQDAVRKHFKREDIFFKVLDDGKRFDDRGTMHQIRNDHAAIIFGLESLAIRLRKNGAVPEWRDRLETLLSILLPHFEQEEKTLFPAGLRVLSAPEISNVQSEMSRCE